MPFFGLLLLFIPIHGLPILALAFIVVLVFLGFPQVPPRTLVMSLALVLSMFKMTLNHELSVTQNS
jgi:type III secretory pathway component EscR